MTKADLPGAEEVRRKLADALGREVLLISAVTGQGLNQLVAAIVRSAGKAGRNVAERGEAMIAVDVGNARIKSGGFAAPRRRRDCPSPRRRSNSTAAGRTSRAWPPGSPERSAATATPRGEPSLAPLLGTSAA